MAKNKLINGRAYDWNSIDIAVPGMQNIEITDISYGSKQEEEAVYGKWRRSERLWDRKSQFRCDGIHVKGKTSMNIAGCLRKWCKNDCSIMLFQRLQLVLQMKKRKRRRIL